VKVSCPPGATWVLAAASVSAGAPGGGLPAVGLAVGEPDALAVGDAPGDEVTPVEGLVPAPGPDEPEGATEAELPGPAGPCPPPVPLEAGPLPWPGDCGAGGGAVGMPSGAKTLCAICCTGVGRAAV
jgi:hypothetical protein